MLHCCHAVITQTSRHQELYCWHRLWGPVIVWRRCTLQNRTTLPSVRYLANGVCSCGDVARVCCILGGDLVNWRRGKGLRCCKVQSVTCTATLGDVRVYTLFVRRVKRYTSNPTWFSWIVWRVDPRSFVLNHDRENCSAHRTIVWYAPDAIAQDGVPDRSPRASSRHPTRTRRVYFYRVFFSRAI